jgi:hypothetical protein
VDRFYPLLSENISPVVERIHTEARRASEHVRRDDAVPNVLGYSGTVEIPIYNKDFSFWGVHLLGVNTTTGPTDSVFSHTATVGSLQGDSFTLQVNRPLHDASGTNQAFTYEGGKVVSWELTAGVHEEAKLSMEVDFENASTATSLAAASYSTGMELLNWAHASSTLTIGGSTVPVTKFSLKVDNKAKTDRHYINGSALKKEQVAEGLRDITWELECDFDALTQYNRVIAATNAAAHAQIIVTLKSNTLGGTTTYPGVTITIPKARFDDITIENAMEPNMQTLSGTAWFDGTNSAVTLVTNTTVATA